MRCKKSTNCMQLEIYFQLDTICEISPKENYNWYLIQSIHI